MKNAPVFIIITLFLGLFIGSCNLSGTQQTAQKGFLDLSDWDLEKKGSVLLNGEWSFFWNTLKSPQDFQASEGQKSDYYIGLPNVWNNYHYQGQDLRGQGYATFHLNVKLHPQNRSIPLAIQIRELSSAYRLWVNGKLLAQNGIVAKSKDEYEPAFISQTKTFFTDRDKLELVLQVANFDHRKGGVWNPIALGTDTQINYTQNKKWAIDLFLFGSLLIMSLYYLGFYGILKRNVATLYFAGFCFLISIRILFSGAGGRFFTYLFPEFPGRLAYTFEIIVIYLALPAFIKFLYDLINSKRSVLTQRIIYSVSGVFILSAIFLSMQISSYLVLVFQFFLLLVFIWVIKDIVSSVLRGNSESIYILFGFLIFSLTIINDMLFANRIINTTYLVPFGLFLFVLFLSFFFSSIFASAFSRIESMKKEMEETNKKLTEMGELKDEFLTNTSHELQTPLNGIIGISESLINGAFGTLSTPVKDNIELIKSSSHRLSNLIGDILDLSKLKRNELVIDLKPVDIKAIVDIVCHFFKEPVRKKQLNLIHHLTEQTPLVYADENRLQQIFFNLIGNAVKYTKIGSIQIDTVEEDDFLIIQIRDTGIGIPDDKHEIIFQSYEQADISTSRAYGGTGLGLSITKQLIELHNGKIELKSRVGEGSVFSFSLPVVKEENLKAESDKHQVEISKSLQDSIPPAVVEHPLLNSDNRLNEVKNILIIDDEPINLQVAINHLSVANYNVKTALNGADGLEMLISGEIPDLILLDIMMPGLNGFDVCEKIRADFSLTELPIIVLSVKNSVTDLVQAFNLGANDYITKPFAAQELLVRVNNQILAKDAYEMLSENSHLKIELESRRQTELELRRVQYKLSKILDHIEEALIGINENLEVSFCNRRFSTLIGSESNVLLGQSFKALFHEKAIEPINELLENTLVKSKELNQYKTDQIEFVHKDGSVFTKNVAWTLIDFEDEKMMMLIVSDYPSAYSDEDIPLSDLYEQNDVLKKLDAELIKAQLKESSQWDLSSIILDDHLEISERQKVADMLINQSKEDLAEKEKTESIRILLVEIMNLAIDYWVMATKTSKIDLARNSAIWKVYTNRDGWERTQTMDKYLESASLPRNPRRKLVIQTAEFVLANCDDATQQRENLELSLMRLKSII